jgi:hypothetical protein
MTCLSRTNRDIFSSHFGLLNETSLVYVVHILCMVLGRAIIHSIGTVFRICLPCVPKTCCSSSCLRTAADETES